MTLHDVINWWPIITGFIAFLVWLVRLEMKVIQTQNEQRAAEARAVMRRAEDLANYQRSWDKMEGIIRDVQTDIKELLQRTSK